MSNRINVDRLLEDWLAEGPHVLPSRVVENIVQELERTEQRGLTWLPGRQMMNRLVLGLGGIAALVLIVAGGLALGLVPRGPGATPTPSPSATPAATALTVGGDALAMGQRYYVDLAGYRYSFTIPASDWNSYPLHGFDAELVKNFTPVEVWLWGEFKPSDTIYTSGCHWEGTARTAGSTAADLATALAGLSDFTTGGPTDISVGSHAAKRVTLTVPDGVTIGGCDLGQYNAWDNARFASYTTPGETDDVTVVDLDNGARHVFFARYFSDTTAATRAEQDEIMQSLTIEPIP